MPRFIFIISVFLLFTDCSQQQIEFAKGQNDLIFSDLATRWDEAIPLGNGMLGALVWQNGHNLRISLDRADLWDLRPMQNLNKPEWKFKWVFRQWENNTYRNVQEYFDVPYDRNAAPSKIPAGALEFDISKLGKIRDVRLILNNALCVVNWESGARLFVFINASEPVGWFRFKGIDEQIKPILVKPPYVKSTDSGDESPVTGQDLRRLGYPEGEVSSTHHSITYNQQGWGGFKYQVHVQWRQKNNSMTGCWSVSSEFPKWEKQENAKDVVAQSFKKGFAHSYKKHTDWWKKFWAKSSIDIPDHVLLKQWYLEMYKFGSAARKGAPPISLQAVWTADNGKLPPWKGDFHHDLNTQLSYWPAYSSNHLDLEQGYIDWLWKYKPTFEKYTKTYFETHGLNVPGVTTLTGEPMGGWIQYSFGPTVSAWLGQHFYLHWRYSMDKTFLREKAYPWIKAVAIYLNELSVVDPQTGLRKLPLSSSPEIFNNSRKAWFKQTTNFDLALIRWTFAKAAELANELDLQKDASRWKKILSEWPDFAVDAEEGFMLAPGVPYHKSHRHFSHLMAIHPLGLFDWSHGEKERQIIRNSLVNLEKYGSDYWVGYSFAWLGNLKARAMDGDGAAEALRTFAQCFCLPNSFHVNGDQSGTGKSKFTYRPFTLEGNFAFAAGIQEMLLQSHSGKIRVFPAIKKSWQDAEFHRLRAEGAFLVSAKRKNGKVIYVRVYSEKGGTLNLANPFLVKSLKITGTDHARVDEESIVIKTKPGDRIEIRRK